MSAGLRPGAPGPFAWMPSLLKNVGPYVRLVNDYIRANAIRSVVDFGCGDFRASRALDLDGARYLGVDIVSRLIDHNTRRFGGDRVRFARLDIGRDRLPPADLCLIKQVLQHWSNADILALLPRLEVYDHVLILDGWLAASATPGRNLDIPTGVGFGPAASIWRRRRSAGGSTSCTHTGAPTTPRNAGSCGTARRGCGASRRSRRSGET